MDASRNKYVAGDTYVNFIGLVMFKFFQNVCEMCFKNMLMLCRSLYPSSGCRTHTQLSFLLSTNYNWTISSSEKPIKTTSSSACLA